MTSAVVPARPLEGRPLALGALVGLAALAALAGCEDRPSAQEIASWRAEARAADGAAKARRRDVEEAGWSLTIAGAIGATLTSDAAPRGVVIDWRTLGALSTTTVSTRSPHVPPYPDRPVEFRGARLADLLERVQADPAADSLTLLCADAYRVEVAAKDARESRILLAVEADGRPIARNMGGPIYAVFPIDDDARIRAAYTHEKWAFYVSAVVVGTEPRRVRVAGKDLDAAALDGLPEVKIESKVGWRVGWPREPITLQGRRLRDVCAAAGRPLEAGDVVVVRGKAPVDRDPKAPHRVQGADALASDVILVERWGATGARVPASKGGPLLLAFPPELAGKYGPGDWVTFVEEIEVRPR